MYFKSLFALFLLSIYFVFGMGFLESRNVFYQLNKKNEDIAKASAVNDLQINTRWIEQKLDQFNSRDGRKWKMRFLENLNFWTSNGPIYLFIGGESQLSYSWAKTGIAYELARETNGALFVSEHRYYGQSKPFNTNNVENMIFLTERQALADIEYLLKYLKQQSSYRNSKIVVIGGSYAGNLAAWMRLLYPNLVDAAISSSAPVLAKKDFYEYLEKVNDNYALYGTQGCIDRIKKKFRHYEELFQSAVGIKQLKKEENICDTSDLNVRENKQLFFANKVNRYMYTSQYLNIDEIKTHCNSLDVDEELSLWNQSKNCKHLDFKKYIDQYRQKENDFMFSWIYQTCTAFGYFQTANSKKQPFTNNILLDFYVKTCQNLFGTAFNERRVDEGVKKVNSMYGGLNINVTNVVFTNGGLDPWSRLGVIKGISDRAPAFLIPHASHCRDLLTVTTFDDEQLQKIVKRIKYLIKNWIGIKS